MSNYNLAVGITMDDRNIGCSIPDDTVVVASSIIAKSSDTNYIAEEIVDGVSRGYAHYIDSDGNEVTNIFYLFDGTTTTTNVEQFHIGKGFGVITEVNPDATLYEYLTRHGNEKYFVVSEDFSKKESLGKDQIRSEIENSVESYCVPVGSVFGYDNEGDIPPGFEEIPIADDDMRY